MPFKTKADLIGEVLKYLAYRDLDIGLGGEPLIYEYSPGRLAVEESVFSAAEKQSEQHLLLHHGLPVEGDKSDLQDDWCFECSRKFLLDTLGPFSKNILESAAQKAGAVEKLTTREAVIALTMNALRLLDEHHEKRMRTATNAVGMREGASLQAEELEGLLKNWDEDDDRVADFYAEWLGQKFPSMIDRAEKLNAISARTAVPESVQRYLIEASRCYVFGQYIGCLAICRAAIELAIGDFLRRNGKQADLLRLGAEGKDGFSARIAIAQSLGGWNLRFTLETAKEVRNWAGMVLHEKPVPPDKCKELFFKARGVLKDLYS